MGDDRAEAGSGDQAGAENISGSGKESRVIFGESRDSRESSEGRGEGMPFFGDSGGTIGTRKGKKRLPELLAPAGGPASFAAALEAGADAVYLGLPDYNARMKADNFSVSRLRAAVIEAHKYGKKVYLTLNSAIREADLYDAYRSAFIAVDMAPDGIIVSDMGMAYLLRKFHRDTPIHASTLVNCHTADGLWTLKRMGFTRVILPRELSFQEIEYLSMATPMETEIFVHGAMCFSQSGICTFSSFLGGKSARRGFCAQPCRRPFSHDGYRRPFFSTKDFMSLKYLKDLLSLPIKAFKIEGRMKDPSYVYRTVKAYRIVMDTYQTDWEIALRHALKLIGETSGRERSAAFLEGTPQGFTEWFFTKESVSGKYVGEIRSGKIGRYDVTLTEPIKKNDRLRIVDQYGHEGIQFKLRKMTLDDIEVEEAPRGSKPVLYIPARDGFSGYGRVYKVGSVEEERKYLRHDLARNILEGEGEEEGTSSSPSPSGSSSRGQDQSSGPKGSASSGSASGSSPSGSSHSGSARRSENIPKKVFKAIRADAPKAITLTGEERASKLWFWLDRAGDFKGIMDLMPARVIIPFGKDNVRALKGLSLSDFEKSKLVISLPPLTFPPGDRLLAEKLTELLESRYLDSWDFMVSNIGQIRLLSDMPYPVRLYADNNIPILNHLAANALFEQGVSIVTLSEELDMDTFKFINHSRFVGGKFLFYLAGRPPLCTSRMRPSFKKEPFVSNRGEVFHLSWHEEGYSTLRSDKGYFLSQIFGKETSPDLIGYIIDLREEEKPLALGKIFRDAIFKGDSLRNSSLDLKTELIGYAFDPKKR
jgi:collagenase-like PrtC family protease